jgi:Protein of unknown function (DUF2934)
MVTVLLIAVLAILVLLYSTGPDGVPGTPHRHRNALLQAQGLRSNPSKGGIDMHRPSIGEQPIKSAPTTEEIRRRAYAIQIERGGFHGCDMDDWWQAERELQKKCNKNSGAVTRKTKPEGGTNASTAKQ